MYEERAKTCRAIYDWAVGECTEDDRRAYAQGKGKPYMDRANRNLAKQAAKRAGVRVNDIVNLVRFHVMAGITPTALIPPTQDTSLRQGPQGGAVPKTGCANAPGCTRWEPYPMRQPPKRHPFQTTHRIPYRPKGRVAPLVCLSNQVINQRGSHTVTIPGFNLHTADAIPKKCDMRSCRLTETTPYRTRGRRTFELHVQVWQEARQQPVNVAAQALDVGGKHVAVTVDTVGHTTIQTMPHPNLLRKIDRLKSKRDSYKNDGRVWRKVNKRIRILQNMAKRVKDNAPHQRAAVGVRGALKVAMEDVDVEGMTARGGNRKRAINRTMRRPGVGKFRKLVIQNAEKCGADIVLVDPRHTSQECSLCRYTDRKNRPGRDTFHCICYGEELHADINAARVILKRHLLSDDHHAVDRAGGQAVLRRRDQKGNQATARRSWLREGPGLLQLQWGCQKVTHIEIYV